MKSADLEETREERHKHSPSKKSSLKAAIAREPRGEGGYPVWKLAGVGDDELRLEEN